MTYKEVEDKMGEEIIPVLDFDTQTKPEGTQNAKVQNKIRFEEREKKKIEKERAFSKKSLKSLEKEAQEILDQKNLVIINKDLLNRLRDVFDQVKEKEKQNDKDKEKEKTDVDEVEAEELVWSLAEIPYFERHMQTCIREDFDGNRENLEDLLIRVKNTYKPINIKWHTFLGFFSKRGRTTDDEQLDL